VLYWDIKVPSPLLILKWLNIADLFLGKEEKTMANVALYLQGDHNLHEGLS